MNGNFKRNLVIGFGLSFVILMISSIASFLSIKSLLDSNGLVNHTQEVIYNLNEGTAVAVSAQTSMRGFIVTGKTVFLEDYRGAQQRADAYFDKVDDLTSDNKEQQASLKELRPRLDQFFNYLAERVEERTAGQIVKATDIEKGRQIMSGIRKISKRMEDRELELLKQRNENSEKYGTYSSVLIIIAAFLSLLFSSIFFIRILNDYKQRLVLQGELEKSERETAQRIVTISNIAEQISEGDYNIRVEDKESDALGSVAFSLNNMARSLESSFGLLSEKEWMQTGIARLNDTMLGEKSIEELANDVIEFVADYTQSNAGVLYLLDGEDLVITAGYSHIPDKNRKYIKLGQGLIGQAAASSQLMEMKTMSEENILITYALGEVKPKHVIAFPLVDNRVEGAIELASVKEFSAREMAFFSVVGNNIGIAVGAAQNRKRLQELLEETQAQSEELRIQHTELESMNAELEVQTEKLQASEEELKVQQEELQQTNEELSERSVLLEEKNTEIQKKSEDLERTTRYKSEFLANMSHELRTPLNSILLLSRLLSENNDENMSSEQIEFANVINSSGNGLLGLIDEILDLSKIEAGKMDLEFIDISTKEITDGLKNLFTEVAKQKGIDFKIVSDKAPVVVKTDKMRLEQILKNLISNAIKFTDKGSVSVEIVKHPTDPKIICFTVKDTGIGIALNQQPLIFEAFQQADGSTKRKYGGTGLGLSISRELAKLLRGEITLKSTLNEGSEFTLCIPLIGSAIQRPLELSPASENEVQKLNSDKAENQYISPVIPDEVEDDRKNINADDKVILIVEDDTNFAKSLLEYTRKRGYKGVVSVRGDYALNFALVYKPVGILLDIQLPIMSGWQVMEELKNNPLTRPIPVHIMSSHQLKQESLLKGAVNFLDKPVAFDKMPEVFQRIERIISRESQKVLIIEDNSKHAKALAYFLESYNINSEIKSEINDGINALQKSTVDCVILDMGIPDKQAYEILENVKKDAGLENLPVIVFTGKSLSIQEELKIKKYADSIIVKTAHSYQRMLDEVSLFLHIVEENKTNGKKGSFKKLNQLNNILHDKTVLVVDDDVRNIYSLTKALEVLKMNVITAIDGKEALAALAQNPQTDVVLLDMMMPNMDGYETAKKIRETPELKNLPVIAVTAKAMTGDREKCINAGASDYITKPVDVDQLLSLLRVWLYDKV